MFKSLPFKNSYQIYVTGLLLIWVSCSGDSPPTSVTEEYEEITLLLTHELEGISDPSGLALDPDGESLWIVSDDPGGGIFRVNIKNDLGNIINHIEMDSDDLEGIIVDPRDNTLWVVEEKLREIVNISRTGIELNRIKLNIDGEIENDGPEGITVNPKTGHFYIVNKKNPRQLHELNPNMEIINTTDINFSGIFELKDLSGISYNEHEDSLWIISDTSEKIVVTDLDGKPFKAYDIGVFDGEGIAVNPALNIVYVVSDEEERLYVFNY